MIKILKNLIIGDTEWKLSPLEFDTDRLNFVPSTAPTTYVQFITSDSENFITSDNKNFMVKE